MAENKKKIVLKEKGDLKKAADNIEDGRRNPHAVNEELARSYEELAKSYVDNTDTEDSSGDELSIHSHAGHGHTHDSHDHCHGEHGHTHSHQHTKQVVNRLARAAGHLDKVKRMVEKGEDCTEVLIQLSAVIAALNRAGKVILEDHIQNCIVDAVKVGDDKAIDDLKNAIDRFL